MTSDAERALWALRAYDATALATLSPAGPHVAGVFFAPEAAAGGITLLLAVIETSRTLRDLRADPRVSFICSPGNTSRWIQGDGLASIPELDGPARMELFRRLAAHAPGSREFVDSGPVRPVVVTIGHLLVVEGPGRSDAFEFGGG